METHIHESNLVEGINDPAQDRQSMTAWRWLVDQRQLNATVVKKLHKMVTHTQADLSPEYKGVFRPIQVYVGSHVPPRPGLVKQEIGTWLRNYTTWTPKEAHVRFETIHPFVDGNGRVGRMLMWWMERKLGQEPTFIDSHRRWEYYAWFKGRGNPLEQTDIFGTLEALRQNDSRENA